MVQVKMSIKVSMDKDWESYVRDVTPIKHHNRETFVPNRRLVTRKEPVPMHQPLRQPEALDGIIDLHGYTVQTAHDNLLWFLQSCKINSRKRILVITGKGDGETSIKREFPLWMSKSEFTKIVASYSPADRKQGGEGAYIVQLKR